MDDQVTRILDQASSWGIGPTPEALAAIAQAQSPEGKPNFSLPWAETLGLIHQVLLPEVNQRAVLGLFSQVHKTPSNPAGGRAGQGGTPGQAPAGTPG